MMKAAIVGFGTISIVHIDAIASNPGMELVAICDINEALAAKVPDGVKVYTDYKQMVEEVKPDVVHNCLPHYLHYPVTKDLVEMGCNVFCEKPIALNSMEAEKFSALEKAHPEVKIGVCLQNRMNETTEELKKIIDSGEYGKVTGIRGFVPWRRDNTYYEAQPWRGKWKYAGGGSMINQSLHTLDLLYFLGGDIAKLHAVVGQTNEYGIEVEGDIIARQSLPTVPTACSSPPTTTGPTSPSRSAWPWRRACSTSRTTPCTRSIPIRAVRSSSGLPSWRASSSTTVPPIPV